jgi:hypothetical protein
MPIITSVSSEIFLSGILASIAFSRKSSLQLLFP